MFRAAVFAVLVVLAVAGCADAPRAMTDPAGVAIARDLVYRRVAQSTLALDLYRPSTQQAEPLPCVVWIHGGGWFRGKKDRCPVASLALHGYVLAAIDYRVTREAVFPAQIFDCKAAIAWLRAHATELRIDPERIGVFGSSAGGHLAALLGTTNGLPDYQDEPGAAGRSSDVRCVCAFFPPTDLARLARDGDPRYGSIRMAIPWLLGAPVERRLAAARAASPVACAGPWAAPFLLFHGTADDTVPIEQSRLLVASLARWKVEARLVELPDVGHDDLIWARPDVQAAAVAFFDRHLRPERLGSSPQLAQTAP